MKVNKDKLKLFIPFFLSSSPTIYHLISNTNIPLIESLLCMSFTIYSIGTSNYITDKIKVKTYLNEHNLIESYEGYDELLKYYNEYLKEFSEFIKYYKIEDAFFFNTLVTKLIHDGYFSFSGLYQYENSLISNKIKNYKEDVYLLGSRVFTDYGICRHCASFLNDINNESGFNSISLLVRPVNENSIYLKTSKLFPSDYSNHMVIGINTKEGKFLFDPTNKSAGEFLSNAHAKRKSIVEFKKNSEYAVTDVLSTSSLIFNDFNYHKLTNFKNSDFKKIEDDKYLKSLKDSIILLEGDRLRFLEFRKKELKLIKTISNLHKQVIDSNNNYHIDNIIDRDEDDPSYNDLTSIIQKLELKNTLK